MSHRLCIAFLTLCCTLTCSLGLSTLARADINSVAVTDPAPDLGTTPPSIYLATGTQVSITAGGDAEINNNNPPCTDVVTVKFDWGDGSPASTVTATVGSPDMTGESPYSGMTSHTYATDGTYTLTVTGIETVSGVGCTVASTNSQSTTLTVHSSTSPTLTLATSQQHPVLGEHVTYTATLHNPPAGSSTYAFGTTGPTGAAGPSQSDSSSDSFQTSFGATGDWTVQSTAKTGATTTESAPLSVQVLDPLRATISGPSTGYQGDTATFSTTATGGYSGAGGYSFDWSVDGVDAGAPSSPNFSISSLQPGRHTVAVTITDDATPDHTTNASADITIVAPISVSESGPRTGYPGQQLTYTAIASGGVTGGTGYQYAWSVDGVAQPVSGATFNWTAAGQPGDHTIGVTVSDGGSPARTASASSIVTLGNALTATVSGPAAAWTGGPALSYTATASGGGVTGATGYHYLWSVDGATQSTSGATLSVPWTTAGPHTVAVTVTDDASPHPNSATASMTVNLTLVTPKLVINNGHDPIASQDVRIDASGSTGIPADAEYFYDWGLGDGFDSGIATGDFTWPNPGTYTVRMYIHEPNTSETSATISQTVTVDACPTSVTFGLIHATATDGCFLKSTDAAGDTVWQPTGHFFLLNGVALPGQLGTAPVTLVQTSAVSGQLRLSAPTINLPIPATGGKSVSFTIPSKFTTLDLPTPSTGSVYGEGYVSADGNNLSVSPSGSIGGFSVGGSIGVELGRDQRGYYAMFPLQVTLPAIFTSGADKSSITTEVNLRVDDDGQAELNKLKIDIPDVLIGGVLKVDDLCFYYGEPQASGSPDTCPQVTLGGFQFPSCSPVSQPVGGFWSGYAKIELTDSFTAELGASVGQVSPGVVQLQYIAGALYGLKIPLTDDVFLTGVYLGYCAGPPLTLTGGLEFSAFPTDDPNVPYALTLHAAVTYTAADDDNPWSLGLSGDVNVYGHQIITGGITFYGDGDVDFNGNLNLSVQVDLPGGSSLGQFSLNGSVDGFIEPSSQKFNVAGKIGGTIASWTSPTVNAVMSDVGAAGCIGSNGVTVGGAYSWSSGVYTPLGGSCDMSDWESTKTAADVASADVASAGRTRSFDVAPGTRAVAVRLFGANGIPRVRLVGPHHQTLTPSTKLPGTHVPNRYWSIPIPKNDSLSVLVFAPGAGTWKVEPLPGSAPVTSMQLAHAEPAPVVKASETQLRSGKVRVKVAYWLPTGEAMRLEAHATKGAAQAVATLTGGTSCATPPGEPKRPGGYSCRTVTYRPLESGRLARTLTAIISRPQTPIESIDLGSIKLRPFRNPAPVVKIARKGTRLLVTWRPVAGATSYTASVKLSNGISLPLPVHGRRAIVTGVGPGISATVSVWASQSSGIISPPDRVKVTARSPKHGSKKGGRGARGKATS